MRRQSAGLDPRPILVPLGGFLGAGKTTLILTAARLLSVRGIRCAAILNDQGDELVDTRLAMRQGIQTDQVTGGCFCCRFSELIDAERRLRAFSPDVIFAEAVGSCTDISATTLQPLQLYFRDSVRLAPYTVLVDPERAIECLDNPDSDMGFLFHKQIAEADLVCFTHIDLQPATPFIPDAPLRYLSPRSGEGVEAWLDEVLGLDIQPGSKILDLDYQRYAKAEASLAWLNCKAFLSFNEPRTPASVVGPLLDSLDHSLSENAIQIAHLKLISECASGYLAASLVRNGAEPSLQGPLQEMLSVSAEPQHELLLNIRALADPLQLETLVRRQLLALCPFAEILRMQCFRPAAPRPQHRMHAVTTPA